MERPFYYAAKNLLNRRTFTSRAHLNQVTAHGLATTAEGRIHPDTQRRPMDLDQEEKPSLLPLPAHPDDAGEESRSEFFQASPHARRLTGTRKPRKCAKRLGVRRLDATLQFRD